MRLDLRRRPTLVIAQCVFGMRFFRDLIGDIPIFLVHWLLRILVLCSEAS